MIKKALVKTVINEFIDSNNIQNPQEVFNRGKELYELLKTHPDFGDLTAGIADRDFMHQMHKGFIIAQSGGFTMHFR